MFDNRIIRRRANAVWPTRCCHLTPLDYYLWGAVKEKCYADKLETIYALNYNSREAIGAVVCRQSIMCLKIGPIVQATAWPAAADSHLNEIIFHY